MIKITLNVSVTFKITLNVSNILNNVECQQHFKYHHSEKNRIKYMYIYIAFIFIDLRCKRDPIGARTHDLPHSR